MRTFLGIVITALTIAAIVIVAVPYLVSTKWIRDQVTAAVRDQTGRELVIAGDTSLSVFPDVSLVVSHATLSNPPGREGEFATMGELDLGLALMPLLSGRVEVDRFVVTRPFIRLEIDEAGAPNWSFAPPTDEAGEQIAASESIPAALPASPTDALPAIESIHVGDMRLIDGVVTVEDHRTGSYQELRDINATIGLAGLDQPLDVDGTMSWQGEELAFRLDLAEPVALATGTPTSATVDLDSAHLKAGFSGTVTVKEGVDAKGDLSVSTPSLKDLSRWLGAQPPRVDGLGPFSLTATVDANGNEIALSTARVTLDDMSAEGGLLVSLAGTKPMIQATLAADRIDVNRYLGETPVASAAPAAATPDGGAPAAGPIGEWNAEPIEVGAFGALDADLRLSARQLIYRNVTAGQSALAVTLKDSVLTVDLSELQLYEGRAVGKLTINGAGELPAIAASFTVNNVAARTILRDTAGLEWLEGRGEISGSLSSRGRTERRLIGALNGEMSVKFTDGAIRGFNIAQMVRNLQGGAVFDWSREEAMSTDFSELSAQFTINKGIAQTDNLQMLGPLVRLSGVGIANLPQRTVDFRINPKLVASLEGQGSAADLSGIEVPFVIRGPWDSPAISPDIEAVLRDPDRAIDTIEQIGRSLEELRNGGDIDQSVEAITGRRPTEFLNMFLGGGDSQDTGAGAAVGGGEPSPPPPISEDAFNRLLGE